MNQGEERSEAQRDLWEAWNKGTTPRYPHAKVIQYTLRNFKKRAGCLALDWGCGTGINSWFLAREGFDVVGTDISEAGISAARRLLAKEGLSGDLRVADLRDVPRDTGLFQYVICVGVFDAVGPAVARDALAGLRLALAPGARGIFVFMAKGDFRENTTPKGMLHPWEDDEVRDIFSSFPGACFGEYRTDYGDGVGLQRDWVVTF